MTKPNLETLDAVHTHTHTHTHTSIRGYLAYNKIIYYVIKTYELYSVFLIHKKHL